MTDETFNINYLAQLARLELTDEEKQHFSSQLGDTLEYFKRLEAIDVEGVEPMAHAFPIYNVLQEDVPSSTFSAEEALANAPKSSENQIVVPKVVE